MVRCTCPQSARPVGALLLLALAAAPGGLLVGGSLRPPVGLDSVALALCMSPQLLPEAPRCLPQGLPSPL